MDRIEIPAPEQMQQQSSRRSAAAAKGIAGRVFVNRLVRSRLRLLD